MTRLPSHTCSQVRPFALSLASLPLPLALSVLSLRLNPVSRLYLPFRVFCIMNKIRERQLPCFLAVPFVGTGSGCSPCWDAGLVQPHDALIRPILIRVPYHQSWDSSPAGAPEVPRGGSHPSAALRTLASILPLSPCPTSCTHGLV